VTTAVQIAGVGIHPFGRFDAGLVDIGGHAVVDALRDADGEGSRRPIDAAYCGTAYGGVATGHRVLAALGLTGCPIVDVEAGCASGAAALMLGTSAVASGQHDRVLVFGVEKMPKGMIRSSFFEPWREQAGLAATPAFFALRAQRFMRDSGVTKHDLARVVVKNRRYGVDNPDAMFRKAVSIDEVLGSRLVCEPLHLWMLCSPNEGAAAVVLERSTGSGITVRATALRSHLPGDVLDESSPLSGIVDAAIEPPTTLAARAAYETAGVDPAELDLVECQDTDAARELLTYEELGLCARGDAVRLIDEGPPVNVSGGLLSKGEPLGASALGQVVELVHQLRGQAGPRQVEGARLGLAHTIGRGANASVVVLAR
jgi:acetyl-CoA acetyltransferase